jgi:RNA polymerase sigma-70 factor, ECF subfamily
MAAFHATLPEPLAAEPKAAARPRGMEGVEAAPSFEVVYDEHFDLVYRNLRRLGVPDALVDDAVQEVFLVVYRRLGQFEGRSSLKTWVCSIVTRVASDHRRALRRKSPHACKNADVVDVDSVPDERAEGPHEIAERREGARLLHALLDELDFDKRTVLVLSELEGMTAPEIADALGENVNTVYARLRAARRDFEAAVSRERARDTWRLR